jgi:hypothetical protein
MGIRGYYNTHLILTKRFVAVALTLKDGQINKIIDFELPFN